MLESTYFHAGSDLLLLDKSLTLRAHDLSTVND